MDQPSGARSGQEMLASDSQYGGLSDPATQAPLVRTSIGHDLLHPEHSIRPDGQISMS